MYAEMVDELNFPKTPDGGGPQSGNGSDKAFWHRFMDFYSDALTRLSPVNHVLEFGIFHGDSIRWLREMYPSAVIVGADILPQQTSWPTDEQIHYLEVDQEDRAALHRALIRSNLTFDLVIEDGSHDPWHQRNSLVASLPWIRHGGLYILEDLHTSATHLRTAGIIKPSFDHLPTRPRSVPSRMLTRLTGPLKHLPVARNMHEPAPTVNCLSLLLALERAQARGTHLTSKELDCLSSTGFFSAAEIESICARVQRVELFRRTGLPLACHACGGTDYDLARLLCVCGTRLYKDDDSMTALIWV